MKEYFLSTIKPALEINEHLYASISLGQYSIAYLTMGSILIHILGPDSMLELSMKLS